MADEKAAENGQEFSDNRIYKYPGARRRSKVWDTFGFLKVKSGPPTKENLDMTVAICRLCRKSYVNKGNTTNFQFHLDHDHAQELGGKPSGSESSQSTNGTKEKPAKTTQSKISHFTAGSSNAVVGIGRISASRQSQIDDALLQLLVAKILPLSLVEHPSFKAFVNLLDPRYSIPSRRQIIRSLEKKKDEMTAKLKSDLEQTESVSITHDGWTSLNTESYNTITAHYIDKDWNMKTAVLETKKMEGSHTSEKIAAALRETEQRWALNDPMATTDNAANEKKAFEILQWPRFGCYGHRLNLVVKNTLSIPEVSKILGKGRSLVTFFHSSSSVSDELVRKQRLLLSEDKVGHKLIMDVATRWNSTLTMLERLCEQTPAIMALANVTDDSLSKAALTKIKNCVYNFEEQAIVERMVHVLKPFEIATTILCAEQSPTMNKVLPTVLKLSHAIAEADNDPPIIVAMKMKMRSQLELRTTTEEMSLLACVVSPYTKDFTFMPDKMLEAHGLLRRSALGLSEPVVVVKIEKPEEVPSHPIDYPPLPELPVLLPETKPEAKPEPEINPEEQQVFKRIKSADTDDWLADVVCMGESKEKLENVVEQEIARYLGSNVKAGDETLTVLQWWKENECFYPRISRLAKKYLACQASSVSSERVFSLAGALVSKKRARLSTSNVDLMIFLNKNRETYW